jgi:hypothetical protein
MAKYLSNRQRNIKVGISSYTEDNTVLEIVGKVGIGTTNPGYKLDINGLVNSKGYIINGDYSAISGVPNAGIYGTDSSFTDGFNSLIVASRTDAARPIIFATYNGSSFAERARITGAGSVGIGTATPDATLAVHGQFKIKTTNGDGNENRLFLNLTACEVFY